MLAKNRVWGGRWLAGVLSQAGGLGQAGGAAWDEDFSHFGRY